MYSVAGALAKYLFLRCRSRYATIGEQSIVWLCDADRAIAALTPLERDLLLLRAAGYTQREIAAALRRSVSTVERRTQQSHSKLSAALTRHQILQKESA